MLLLRRVRLLFDAFCRSDALGAILGSSCSLHLTSISLQKGTQDSSHLFSKSYWPYDTEILAKPEEMPCSRSHLDFWWPLNIILLGGMPFCRPKLRAEGASSNLKRLLQCNTLTAWRFRWTRHGFAIVTGWCSSACLIMSMLWLMWQHFP